MEQYKTPEQFLQQFRISENDWNELQSFAIKDSVDLKGLNPSAKSFTERQMENLLARQIWRSEGYYEISNADDPMIKKALEVIK